MDAANDKIANLQAEADKVSGLVAQSTTFATRIDTLQKKNTELTEENIIMRKNMEAAIADAEEFARLLGLNYDFDDGKNLKNRLADGEYDLLVETKAKYGLEEVLRALKAAKQKLAILEAM